MKAGRFVVSVLGAGTLFVVQSIVAEPIVPPKLTYRVERITESITVDGALEEAVWKSPPTFTLDYETSPDDNVAAPVKTEMWIAYDDSNVYIAARAHDPDVNSIRARLRDRDNAYNDDFLGVALDTFNDERRAFEFFVNPYGVQMDLTMNDVTGNEDDSWDAIWASAGKITAEGYEVEIAVPFSSLRFPESGSSGIWGIDALRIRPREQRYRLGLNPQPRGGNCYLCNESKLEGFDGIKAGKNMEFDPTFTAVRAQDRPDPSTSFQSDSKTDPGLTARWGITPGVTVNGTLNPDFSQVEADAAQLTVNTQFAIFYPEKRPFFLEGADFFDTKIMAIYTRDLADPSWGTKISGKQGKSAFGAIVARDDQTNFIFPSNQTTDLGSLNQENTSSIFRYRYDIGSGSTVGGLFTDREGEGYHNRVLGMDLFYRHEAEAVRIETLGSDTEYPLQIQQDFNQPEGALRGTAIRAVYQHETRDWTGYVQYMAAADDFRADLGFIPQVGYHKNYDYIEKYWYSDSNARWWNKLTLGGETTWTYDRQGNPLQQQVASYFLMNGRHQFFGNLYLAYGPLYYNGRRFDRTFANYYMELQPTGSFYIQFETRIGQEVDFANTRQGEILRFIPQLRFDLGRHLKLQVNNTFEHLSVEGGPLYRASVIELRTTYQINTRTFVRLITQYFDVSRHPERYTFEISNHDQQLFNQFLFSYKINPQIVLFLGYSDNYQNSPQYDLSQGNRTLFFKVGYAFVL